VHANEARLGQVFLNLLVNAAQAIPEGSADKNMIKIVTQWNGGDRVIVEVHDTGAGIPPEVAARIFEPFFTTKAVGSGTGLGLAIVHRIVASLSGRVAAEPRPGGGTIFHVELPTARKYELATSAPPVQKSIDRRAQILVVDDEPMISSAVRRILGREHDVVATDAMGALKAIEGGRRFDVILCDVMMPDMSGVDL